MRAFVCVCVCVCVCVRARARDRMRVVFVYAGLRAKYLNKHIKYMHIHIHTHTAGDICRLASKVPVAPHGQQYGAHFAEWRRGNVGCWHGRKYSSCICVYVCMYTY